MLLWDNDLKLLCSHEFRRGINELETSRKISEISEMKGYLENLYHKVSIVLIILSVSMI